MIEVGGVCRSEIVQIQDEEGGEIQNIGVSSHILITKIFVCNSVTRGRPLLRVKVVLVQQVCTCLGTPGHLAFPMGQPVVVWLCFGITSCAGYLKGLLAVFLGHLLVFLGKDGIWSTDDLLGQLVVPSGDTTCANWLSSWG